MSEPESIQGEVVEAGTESGLATMSDVEQGRQVSEQMRAHFDKMKLEMDLKWEEERRERERWSAEDKIESQRVRVAALIAGSIVSDGAMGVKPRVEQVASYAIELTDAVLDELTRTLPKRQERHRAARAAAAAKK